MLFPSTIKSVSIKYFNTFSVNGILLDNIYNIDSPLSLIIFTEPAMYMPGFHPNPF